MTATPHGGQVYQFAQTQPNSTEHSLQTVLDFSASINPIQPTVDWTKITQSAQTALVHYPDNHYHALTESLANTFDLSPNQITLTNGISSAILTLFSHLKPDTTLLFTPIYSEYQRGATAYSQTVIEVFNQTQLSEQHLTQLTANSVVVLVNPSTPQGNFTPPKSLMPLIQQLKTIGCWFWVDESFLPFIGFQAELSFREQLNAWPKLIILQSLTKYYACPGIRIGALFTHPNALTQIEWSSWPISVLDEHFLRAALNDLAHPHNTQQFLTTERPRFITALQQSPLVAQVHSSQTNFLLVKIHVNAQWLSQQLHSFNILIRPCDSFGLGRHHIRIAIKSQPQNQQLIEALTQIEQKHPVLSK
ncbi:MAG: aminotransferase class I/II-fold pyridoxal phosphate-dependent enzyme [Thiomicrorhabdus sp.]|nr:aminotransferase class I/II-fold pyridoxal phosphate-dependent enzyme [Thiomicrorhabdus sp.]